MVRAHGALQDPEDLLTGRTVVAMGFWASSFYSSLWKIPQSISAVGIANFTDKAIAMIIRSHVRLPSYDIDPYFPTIRVKIIINTSTPLNSLIPIQTLQEGYTTSDFAEGDFVFTE
ncbi:hypothetical protein RJT34_20175 [Clitoria ternatea]|uniref:Uncharacterized protein n=1 Tax=Clitoria ternatea TaxID=43366 RepID=A0AAN9ISD6_CLITE